MSKQTEYKVYLKDPVCPYCNRYIDPFDIMGASDWDDQQYEPYETECPHCDKLITMTQVEVEVIRHFSVAKEEV